VKDLRKLTRERRSIRKKKKRDLGGLCLRKNRVERGRKQGKGGKGEDGTIRTCRFGKGFGRGLFSDLTRQRDKRREEERENPDKEGKKKCCF